MSKSHLCEKKIFSSIQCLLLSIISQTIYASPFLHLLSNYIDKADFSNQNFTQGDVSAQIRKRLDAGIQLIVLYDIITKSCQELYDENFEQKSNLSSNDISHYAQLLPHSNAPNTTLQKLQKTRGKITNKPFILGHITNQKPFTYFDWLCKRENKLIDLQINPIYGEIVPDLMNTHEAEISQIYKELINQKLTTIHSAYNVLNNDEQLITYIAKSFQIKVILDALREILEERFRNKYAEEDIANGNAANQNPSVEEQFRHRNDVQNIFNAFEMKQDPSTDEVISLTNNADEKLKKLIRYCAESTYILPLHFQFCCQKHLKQYQNDYPNKEWSTRRNDTMNILTQAFQRTQQTLNAGYFTDSNRFMFQRLLNGSVLENFRFTPMLETDEPITLEQYCCNEFNAKYFNQNNIDTISDLVELTNDLLLEEKIDQAKTYDGVVKDSMLTEGISYYYALKALRDNLLHLLNEFEPNTFNLLEIPKDRDRLNRRETYLRIKRQDHNLRFKFNPFYLKILCYDYLDQIISRRYTSQDLLKLSAQQAKNHLNNLFFGKYTLEYLKQSLKEEFLFFANRKGLDNYIKAQAEKQKDELLKIEWKNFNNDLEPNNTRLYESPAEHFKELRESINYNRHSRRYKELLNKHNLNRYQIEIQKTKILQDMNSQKGNLKNISDAEMIFKSEFFPLTKIKNILNKKIEGENFEKAYQDTLASVKDEFDKYSSLGDLKDPFIKWLHDVSTLKNLDLTLTREQILRVILMHINTNYFCKNLTFDKIESTKEEYTYHEEINQSINSICILPSSNQNDNQKIELIRPKDNMKTILRELPTRVQFMEGNLPPNPNITSMEEKNLLGRIIHANVNYRNKKGNTAKERETKNKEWITLERESLNNIEKEANEYFLEEKQFNCDIHKIIKELVQERRRWLDLEENFILDERIGPLSLEEEKKKFSPMHDYRDYDPELPKYKDMFSAPRSDQADKPTSIYDKTQEQPATQKTTEQQRKLTLNNINQPKDIVERVQRIMISWYRILLKW